jgi:DoxX-like family
MATLGIPQGWLFPLGALKAAGALGLLAGIGVPLLVVAAAAGLVLFFVGAVIIHVHAASTAASPTRGRSCCWPRGRWRCGWPRPKRHPMVKNWTLTRTEPPPQAASLERWLALGGVAGPVLFGWPSPPRHAEARLFARRPGDQRPWDRRGRLDRERLPGRLCDQLFSVHATAVPHGVAGRRRRAAGRGRPGLWGRGDLPRDEPAALAVGRSLGVWRCHLGVSAGGAGAP